jgi:hypothetical protein
MTIDSIARQRADFVPTTGANVGAVAAASAGYVSAEEMGNAIFHHTLLTFLALPVVTGNTTGASFGSKQIYTFPEGRLLVQGVTAYFNLITFNTVAGVSGDIGGGGSGDYSIGTTATADATLATTDVDLLPSTAMLDPFVAGVGSSNAGAALAASAQFDGTSAAKSAYLNVIIDDADVADAASADNVYFTGTVRITWTWLGDY